MPEAFTGPVDIADGGGAVTIRLDGNTANGAIGGGIAGGVLVVRDPSGAEACRVDGIGAVVRLGANGNAGDLRRRTRRRSARSASRAA